MKGAPSSGAVLVEISQQNGGTERWPVIYPINRPCLGRKNGNGLSQIFVASLLRIKSTIAVRRGVNHSITTVRDNERYVIFIKRVRMHGLREAGSVDV